MAAPQSDPRMARRGWVEIYGSDAGGYDVYEMSEHHDSGHCLAFNVPWAEAERIAWWVVHHYPRKPGWRPRLTVIDGGAA